MQEKNLSQVFREQMTASAAKFDLVAGAWRHYALDVMVQSRKTS